ncbi:MAG: 30S ribosomal protein S12 methylthiotransferase RimO [Marinilabiliales bacterium]
MNKQKVNIITLGCSKNLVDSEYLLHKLKNAGFDVYHDSNETDFDYVLINTCGFIGDAKEESIEMILNYAEEKQNGNIKKLIVFGCLSQRYSKELINEIPEADAFFGAYDQNNILKYLNLKPDKTNNRFLTTPQHFAYLKLSEGCDRTCSFCAIPLIKGKYKSRNIDDVIKEATLLAKQNVKELILIAQDLTYYGIDLYKKPVINKIVNELSLIDGIEWIRLHYTYPVNFPESLIDEIASNDKVCKYLDIPVQHISDNILKRMRRNITKKETIKLLEKIKNKIPDISLRTTLMVGFPGESSNDFNELKEFVKDFQFDRLGVFQYSHEEDTYAYLNYKDDIPESIKCARHNEIMKIQEKISFNKNTNRIGNTYKVLVDRKEGDYFIGRTQYDSPEVDNEVIIKANSVKTGEFYNVIITDAEAYDLFGVVKENNF